MAIATAARPTAIDTRAPYSKRANTSRPAESVPSTCVALGGFFTASRSTANGSGARTGARMASATTIARMTSATPATRSRRKRAHAVLVLRRGAAPSATARGCAGALTAVATLAVPNPGIGVRVQDVRHQVAQQHQRGGHERQPHQHRIVALLDRRDGQRPHARPLEHVLDHDGAAEQEWYTKRHHRDDWQKRVAERVA